MTADAKNGPEKKKKNQERRKNTEKTEKFICPWKWTFYRSL